MSKIVKVLLLCTYIVLITRYIKLLIMSKTQEEVLKLEYFFKNPELKKHIDREMKNKKNKSVTITTNIPERLPTDLKFILQFSNVFPHKSSYLTRGQDDFIDAKCKYMNCFITSDKNLLFGLQYFDAILFDVENFWDGYPLVRSPHQTYIFVASEPAADNPICNKIFDDFYNLTWTYKLDSDINWSYMTIYDKNGTVVGPKIDMQWKNPMDPISEDLKKKLDKKNKVAAWFVSNCNTQSKRGVLFENLKLEFLKYNMTIDVFGWCGKQKCPKDNIKECLDVLDKNYYFYLAFENSMCEDYVTERVLHALFHYTVPIVYGGANYTRQVNALYQLHNRDFESPRRFSHHILPHRVHALQAHTLLKFFVHKSGLLDRFLPPGSYINADEETPESLVALVIEAMQNRKIYEDYFRWHNHYVYKRTDPIGDLCTLCDIMNMPLVNKTVRNFRNWWNPGYKSLSNDCHKYY